MRNPWRKGPKPVRFKWLTAESNAATLAHDLRVADVHLDHDRPQEPRADDVDEYADAGFEPMLMLTGAAGIALLVRTVSRVVRDHTRGGVVVDTRGKALTIVEGVRGVDAGTLLVVGDDDTQVFAPADDLSALAAVLQR